MCSYLFPRNEGLVRQKANGKSGIPPHFFQAWGIDGVRLDRFVNSASDQRSLPLVLPFGIEPVVVTGRQACLGGLYPAPF